MALRIEGILSRIYAVIMIAVLALLLLFSVISTSYVTANDGIFYVGDRAYLHGLILLCIALLGMYLKKKAIKPDGRIVVLVGALVFILLTVYVFQGALYPKFDQRRVMQIAELAYDGIYDDFLPGGYLDVYPQQNGVVLMYELYYRFFGLNDYLAIQYVNLLLLVVFMAGFYQLIKLLLPGRENASLLCTLLFAPFWGYVTQIYGNIPAMALGVWAMYLIIRYLREEKLVFAVSSAVLIALSVIMKENFLILLIALEIMILFRVITDRKPRLLVAAFLCLVLSLAGVKLTDAVMTSQTGIKQEQGVSMLSYYAMGMHEHPERGAGWYDGFNEQCYEEGGFITAKASAIAKEDILASYDNFRAHPAYFVGFYIRKIACMWNEPTCDSIATQWGRTPGRDPGAVASLIINEGSFTLAFTELMNLMWTPLIFGALWFFIELFRKKKGFEACFAAIFFTGGFLFHFLIWETGSYYTFYYIMMLIPYAVSGWSSLCGRLLELDRKKLLIVLGSFAVIVLILSIPQVASFLTLNRDNARYAGYLAGS